MASDWIKVRGDLRRDFTVFRMARALEISPDEMLATLIELAGWFATQGKHGKIKAPPSVVDSFTGVEGLAWELMSARWLEDHNGTLCLRGFCTVSTKRKSLGKRIRSTVLDGATCAACGTTDNLVIDHIVPVVRGGSCDLDNLQALCWSCNAAKGRKTMTEFMGVAL